MLRRVCLSVLFYAVAVYAATEYSFPGSWNSNNAADTNALGSQCSGTSNPNLWYKAFSGTAGDTISFRVVLNRSFNYTTYGMGAAATNPQLMGKSFIGSSATGAAAINVVVPASGLFFVWFNAFNNEIGVADDSVCVDSTSTLSCSGDVTVFGSAATCTLTPRITGNAVKAFSSWFRGLSVSPTNALQGTPTIVNTYTAANTFTFTVSASNTTGMLSAVTVNFAIASPVLSTSIVRRDPVYFFGNFTGGSSTLNDAAGLGTQCNNPTQLLITEKVVTGTAGSSFSFKVNRGGSTAWIVGCSGATYAANAYPKNCSGISTTAAAAALFINPTFPASGTLYLTYVAPSTSTGRGTVYVTAASMCATPDSTSQLVCPTIATPSSTVSCYIVPRQNNVMLSGAYASYFSPASSSLVSASLRTGSGSVGALTGNSLTFTYTTPITASTVNVGVALASNTATITTSTNLAMSDFSPHMSSFSVAGDATLSGTTLRLQSNSSGSGSGVFSAAFLQGKYPMLAGFEVGFSYRIDGRVSLGGEEFGLAIQSTGASVANRNFNGFYLKMDTNNNVGDNDPGSNFFALFTSATNDYNQSLIQDRTDYLHPFEDGNLHRIHFSVSAVSSGSRTWTVKFDDAVRYTGSISEATFRALLDSNGNAFVGFLARKTSITENIYVHELNVTTNDNQAPVFQNCPSGVAAATFDLNRNDMYASWTTPTATDNSVVVYTNSTHNSGDLFTAGTTQVTYMAFDSAGNMATCVFNVVVTVEVPTCTEFPPYLDTAQTKATGGNLTVMIVSSQNYISTALQFVNGDSECASFSPVNYWTPYFFGTCNTFYKFTVNINTAIAKCSFNNDEATTSTTTFRATIVMTTVKSATPIRGVALNTTRVTAVTLGIGFPTAVTVATSTVNVFGTAIQYAQVQTQNYNPATYTAVIGLLTSMQFPYQLLNPKVDQIPGYYINVTVINPDPSESSASSCNATGADNWQDGGSCSQVWDVLIVPLNPCIATNALNITNLGVYFDVMCMTVFNGSCTPPATYNTSLAFTASSTDYCPKTITYNSGTVGLNMSLVSYQDEDFATPQNQFVFGTRIYFRAIVSSLITMSDLRFERISLLSGAATGVSALYSNPFTNASDFFGANPQAGVFTQVPNQAFTVDSTSSLTRMTINEPITSNSYVKQLTFSWVWSDEVSNALSDTPENTVVQVTVRVRFANVSIVGHTHQRAYTFNVPLTQLLADNNVPASTSGSTIVAVQKSGSIGGSSASSGFLGTGVAVEIMASLIAVFGVALMTFAAVAVWYMRRDRNRKSVVQSQVESVNLDSVSSTSP